MKALRQLAAILATALLCVSCSTSPVVGYRVDFSSESLVVTREFQFTTGPSPASHMNHTWTIPAGVYHAQGNDAYGTYYAAPHRTIGLRARFGTEPAGGLYRRSDTFFTYTQATTEMYSLLVGGKPYVWDQVPLDFAKFVTRR